MPRPPRDPDDLDDVLGQVSDALDELEVVEGDDREALLGSLREVLGALGGLPLRGVEVHALRIADPTEEAAGAPPAVRLVDGGLAHDAPIGEGPRPELRLAEEDCGDPDTHPHAADPDVSPGPASTHPVKVLRIGRPRGGDLGEPLGEITLSPAPEQELGQVLFVGTRARAYRVRCLAGELTVHAGQSPVATLLPGQTVDVEARRIRVSARAPAHGRYLRLPG